VAFSYSKSRTINNLRQSFSGGSASLKPGVRNIAPVEAGAEMQAATVNGWTFSMPRSNFVLASNTEGADTFTGQKLTVKIDGVRSKQPEFKAGFAPSNPQVIKYFSEVDPYQLLVDAFSSSLADVEKAATPAELQKSLYMLLLNSALQSHGAQKLWQQIKVKGRDGFLSGDESCAILVATIYLPQTRQFAEIIITPRGSTTMEEIYGCLASLDIKQAPEPIAAGGIRSFPKYEAIRK
jgi:hypothetical protein